MRRHVLALLATLLLAVPASAADVGNRLAYLNEFCDPYYVGLSTAKFVTPQWIGDEGVEFAVVLAIDDFGTTAVYEKFLRPVFERLKQVDGRAPVSMMTGRVKADDPQIQAWLKEGVNLETHTYDHPCPCLGVKGFANAKATFDHAIDFLIPKSRRRPERLVQAINAPYKNTIGTYLFTLSDTREARGEASEAYAFLNDSAREVTGDVIEALHAYDVKAAPWSRRDQFIADLAN